MLRTIEHVTIPEDTDIYIYTYIYRNYTRCDIVFDLIVLFVFYNIVKRLNWPT